MREEPIATEARCPVVVPADGGVGGSGWEYSHPSYCGAALCTFENVHASVQLFLTMLRVLPKFMCTYAAHKEYEIRITTRTS